MDWKDLASKISQSAPLLGSLIAGPAGGAVGAVIASAFGVNSAPADVAAALAHPDAAVKLREVEANRQIELQALVVRAESNRLAAETAAAESVNATIRAEAASEHWPSYSWRPFLGFCVGLNVIFSSALVLVVFVPVMFGVETAANSIAQLPGVLGALAAINATVLPVLGIASWYRGKMQADPNIPTNNRG
ncbi:MAG: hypothetical protein IPO08_23580 [Xanthomonadales bacterium]|nr:hypothetical protein [Xanthomonadales bacterium]